MTAEPAVAARRGALAWLAIVAPVWLACVLCTHWEPVLRDGWGHLRWHLANPVTVANTWEFAKAAYTGGNPRLGQTITMLLMTPGPYHAIVTPVVEVAMFALLATLALGRAPSWRRVDDALVFATIVAVIMLATPQSGSMLFYRPFTGNYVYGFAIDLAWLVPYRLHVASARAASSWWAAPVMLVVGAIAGMCNEHTPPALAVLAVLAAVLAWRRDRRIPVWMIAGVLGLLAGWIAVLLAPGQALRYSGLAMQESTVERIADRGVVADAIIVGRVFLYLGATLPWLVLGAIAKWRAPAAPQDRARLVTSLVGLGASVVVALTLLGSPKEGQRLYFAACAFGATAIAGWVTAQLDARWARLACVALTTCALAFAGWRCLHTYATLDTEYRARRELIDHGSLASAPVVVVPRYSIEHDWWTLGEDFDAPNLRQFVANTFDLGRIDLASPPPPR